MTDPVRITWAELVARITAKHGERQRLADELEVDRKSVYDWAHGISRPRGRNARLLRERAHALGYVVDESNAMMSSRSAG